MKTEGKVFKYPDNVDTDVIIPARYLNTSNAKELALHCMEDIDTEFVKRVEAGDVMVAGWNFGCGSSREHAPQAIKRSGIQAIVAETFAEIFFGNSSGIGLPCVRASREDLARAMEITSTAPDTQWTVDLESMTLSCATASFPISMPAEPREALMQGKWDAVVELMNAPEAVAALAAALPAPSCK